MLHDAGFTRLLLRRLPARSTVVAMALLWAFAAVPSRAADTNEQISDSLATLLRTARAVISDNQNLINDPSKGDKGLSAAVVVGKAKEGYKKILKVDIASIDAASFHGKMIAAELSAISAVMDDAQASINKQGVGFKGFLPAVFARLVTQKFNAAVGAAAKLKLTAPKEYVRNRANRPDGWESEVIEKQFRTPGYPTGKPVSATTMADGKKAFRLILPEYYTQSCLACHGEPKGERDITGGKKEGAKLGDLGGAISVTIFE